jgi:mRNA interferase RelE/StbE
MKVAFTRAAEKSFFRLAINRQTQILGRIQAFADDPNNRRLHVEPLAGSELLRLRVGNYRVLFSTDEVKGVLTVELIRTRGDVYKR